MEIRHFYWHSALVYAALSGINENPADENFKLSLLNTRALIGKISDCETIPNIKKLATDANDFLVDFDLGESYFSNKTDSTLFSFAVERLTAIIHD